jgi:hypothetical protein
MPRKLSAALLARSAAVKTAHAHLSTTVPGFRAQPPIAQFKAVHAHLKTLKGAK